MVTKRIFDENPYLTEASSKVVSVNSVERDGQTLFATILDATIFFPEEGGQSPDQGSINGIEVVDVQVQGKDIVHFLKCELAPGAEARMEIDWNHRFSNMQQHSAEHIFSGTVHRLFGFDNVGFHLSDNSVTMDFNGVLTEEDMQRVEHIVNEAITKNIEIDARYVDSETLSTLSYRIKKELEGPIRIVTIPGYDVCACCAPHVHRTGEIGFFKIIHAINYKGGVRINYLCGFRALEYFRESLKLIDNLTNLMTTGRENLVEHIDKLKNEKNALSGELLNAKSELMNIELAKIPETEENVVLFKENTDAIIIKNAVNALMEKHTGLVAFFTGSDEEGYSYILASKSLNTNDVQKCLAEKLGAKGGGKPNMIRGKIQATESEIRDIIL